MPKVKTPAFPNEYFESQEEYFKFQDRNPGYFGKGLYDLKKEEDRRARLLVPVIRPR